MANLPDFLHGLATQPAKLTAFKQDAKKSMADAGLTEAEKAIVLSGDPHKIRTAMQAKGDTTVVVVVAVL